MTDGSPIAGGTTTLRLKGEAPFSHVEVAGNDDLIKMQTVHAWRLRLALNGGHEQALASGGFLTPSLELARINHQFGNWAPYCLEISLQYCLWPVQSMIRHFSAQLKHKVSNLVVIEEILALVRHYGADFDTLSTPRASVKTGHWMF